MLCPLESSDGTFNQVPSNAYIPVLGHLSEACLVTQRLEQLLMDTLLQPGSDMRLLQQEAKVSGEDEGVKTALGHPSI